MDDRRFFDFQRLKARPSRWCPLVLALAPLSLTAQTISTTREAEFRSRWSNYHVDQPQAETVSRTAPPGGEEHGIAPVLRSLFRTGPIILRASVTNGWEYSNAKYPAAATTSGKRSTSSFFTAPAALVSYDREVGSWGVSFRYSAGYLRYLERDYAPSGGATAGGLSQTAALNVEHKGSRLVFRTAASASSGSGFDIERNRQTERKTIGGTVSADYSITEFTRTGASLSASHQSYSGQGSGLDDLLDQWTAILFGESILTGKTSVRLEFGAGGDTQDLGGLSTRERSYYQSLLRFNYQPTAKFTLTPAFGGGIREVSGGVPNEESGFRALYSLGIDYAPSEKTAIRLFIGLEGASPRPELSLTVNWHPRENTRVNLSIYQHTGFSTILDNIDRTQRGVLLAGQQRLFSRINLGLGAGWEQEESIDGNTADADPYYFFSTTIAWELNSWLVWQAQYRFSSGRSAFAVGSDVTESRASTSFQLTF